MRLTMLAGEYMHYSENNAKYLPVPFLWAKQARASGKCKFKKIRKIASKNPTDINCKKTMKKKTKKS